MSDTPPRRAPGPPGAISMFFVAKAALFGVVCWAWLLFLIDNDSGDVSGWELFAACGGICFTLVAVALGVRFAIERAATLRHGEVMKEIADLSWHTLAQTASAPDAQVLNLPTGPERHRR
jgi:hypothetical protein